MTNSFSNLHLAEPLAKAIAEMGYASMTPIQAQAIPVFFMSSSLMRSAKYVASFIIWSRNAAPSRQNLALLLRHGGVRC